MCDNPSVDQYIPTDSIGTHSCLLVSSVCLQRAVSLSSTHHHKLIVRLFSLLLIVTLFPSGLSTTCHNPRTGPPITSRSRMWMESSEISSVKGDEWMFSYAPAFRLYSVLGSRIAAVLILPVRKICVERGPCYSPKSVNIEIGGSRDSRSIEYCVVKQLLYHVACSET